MATIENIISLRDESTPVLKKISASFSSLSDTTDTLTKNINKSAQAIEKVTEQATQTKAIEAYQKKTTDSFAKIQTSANRINLDKPLYISLAKTEPLTERFKSRMNRAFSYVGDSARDTSHRIHDCIKKSLNLTEQETERTSKKVHSFFKDIVGGNLVSMGIMKIVETGKDAIRSFMDTANHVASINGRLQLITGNANSANEAFNKLYQSAQLARGDFLSMADASLRIKMNAGATFQTMDDAIKFTESMQKVFAIGGSTAEEQRSAMLQLSQALASGKLQGDELHSVAESAPQVLDYIAKTMNISRGAVKKLASQGLITADIVKRSMIDNAQDIDKAFNKLPKTWSQLATQQKNTLINATRPVMEAINNLANNTAIQGFIGSFISAITSILPAIRLAFIGAGYVFTYIGHVIGVITNFIIKHKTALNILKGVLVVLTGVIGVFATASLLSSVATGIATAATSAWAIVQWGLNSALYACPLLWIVAGIVAVTSAITALIYYLTDAGTKATTVAGSIAYAFTYAYYTILDACIFMWNGTIKATANGLRALNSATNSIGNFFIDMWNGIKQATVEAINSILTSLRKIPMLSKMFDLSPVSVSVTPHFTGVSGLATDIEKYGNVSYTNANQKALAVAHAVDSYFSSSPSSTGASTPYSTGGINPITGLPQGTGTGGHGGGGSHALRDTAKNTKQINEKLGLTNEQLKLMRSSAEREAINKFTQGNIKIDLGGISVSKSDTDNIDGMLVQLKQVLVDAVKTGTERACI